MVSVASTVISKPLMTPPGEGVAGGIAAHVHLSGHALRQIDHHNTALAGFRQHLNKLAILWGIADAIGAEDQRFHRLAQKLRTTSAEMPG